MYGDAPNRLTPHGAANSLGNLARSMVKFTILEAERASNCSVLEAIAATEHITDRVYGFASTISWYVKIAATLAVKV
jgi:hypothetical protein